MAEAAADLSTGGKLGLFPPLSSVGTLGTSELRKRAFQEASLLQGSFALDPSHHALTPDLVHNSPQAEVVALTS